MSLRMVPVIFDGVPAKYQLPYHSILVMRVVCRLVMFALTRTVKANMLS